MHEKIFITFMVTSLTYMLVSLRLLSILQPNGPTNQQEQRSVYYKKMFFALSIASTIGLIVFFLKHRLLCHDLAFSWFALCEYLIAFSNMGFHCTTTMIDFPPKLNLLVKTVDGHLTIEDTEDQNTAKTD
jgi:post-GPI attachment to proteins factor 2